MPQTYTLCDPEIERTILGSILLDNAEYDAAVAYLTAGDFYLDSHQRIFRAIGRMISAGHAADIQTLANQLDTQSELQAIGGRAYLFQLTEGLPRRANVEQYATQVLDLSRLRRLAALGEELAEVSTGSGSAAEVIERARGRLEEIVCDLPATERTEVSAYSSEVLNKWLSDRAKPKEIGLSYGIRTLDARTGGMYPGENTTVGADPGVGKSAFSHQAIAANCATGHPVFLVSLEMTRAQVLRRLWGKIGHVDPARLRRPQTATFSDEQYVTEAEQTVRQWPLHIYDKSTVRLEQLTGMLRLAIRKHKVELFIVDFAQIVAAGGKDFREQVSKATGELTAIAKGEGVHLMLLSQMSRKTRQEWNRPPRLSDLRESGALEQNAHCVVLIHRPYDEKNGHVHTRAAEKEQPGCELIIAKQREGGTSTFPVTFNEDTLSFEG